MIQSPYTITLTPAGSMTPITLVAAGGWLAELPVWEASQGLFESDGVNLGQGYFRPLGGVVVIISFSVEAEHADLVTALEAFLDAGTVGADDLLQISGAVTFTPPAGPATVFGEAVATAVTPDLPSGPTATTTQAFTIQTTLPN